MKRFASVTRLTVAVTGLMVSLAGCRCGDQPPTCGDVVVSFDSPADGATVNGTLDVTIKVTDAAGNPIEIVDPKLETRASTAADFTTSGATATVTTGAVTFTGVSLQTGSSLLKASATQKSNTTCTGTRTITVAVKESLGTPEVTSFTFPADANADKVLNNVETPLGTAPTAQLEFKSAENCTVVVKGTLTDPAGVKIVNEKASVNLDSLASVMQAGPLMLQAVVTCDDGRKNDLVANTAASTSLTINRVSPTCAITEPSKALLGPNDDADAIKAGFQLRAVTTATGAATIEIKLTGGTTPLTSGALPPVAGGLSYDFDVPADVDVNYTVAVEAKDAAGNICPAQRDVEVDLQKPVITITSPTAAHGTYTTSFNIPITANVTGAAGQSVSCSSTLGNIGGPFPVSNGTISGTGSFSQGMQTVTCSVTDAAGNTGTASQTIDVNVPSGISCPLSWTRPPASPAYLTRMSGLVSGSPPTLAYQFQLQSSAACAGNVVRLYQVSGATKTLLDTGSASSTGQYTFAATLPSSSGLTVTYEGQIDNTSPALPTSATQQIVVDLDTPSIVLPAAGPLNVNSDTNPSVAGVQRSLSVTPALPANTTLTICSDVMLAGSPGACPDGVGFIVAGGNGLTSVTVSSFTFPDGTYSFKPVFVNGTTTNTGALVAYQVNSVRPRVLTAVFTGDANADNILNATELPTGNPTLSLTFMNAPDGSDVSVVDLDTNLVVSPAGTKVTAGAASFALALGLNATSDVSFAFQVLVTTPAPISNTNNQSGATAVTGLNPQAFFSLRVDRVPPTCVIAEPSKAQLGIADDASVAAGYQLHSSVTTSTDVGTTGVAMTLTGGASPQNFSGGPASGGSTLSHDFTVASTGTTAYSLAVVCTDSAGNAATATSASVTVDLDAPTCTLNSPNAAGSPYTVTRLLPLSVTATGANGLNAIITTVVGAGPAIQLASLPISGGAASDPGTSFPNGAQVVTVTVTDQAGNSCTNSQSITVTVSTCDIQFTFPAVDPATLNGGNGTVAGTSLTWNLTGTASNCPGLPVSLYKGTGGSRMLVGTSTATAGNFSFSVTTAEGPAVHYEVEMNNGTVGLNTVDVSVDVTPPVLSSVLPAGPTLFYVAPGNRNFDLGTSGYILDADPVPSGAAGAQATVTFSHTGAVGGKAEVFYQGLVVGSINPITMATPSPASIAVTLPQSTVDTLVVRLTDAAGNKVEQSRGTTVDVVPPANPVLSVSLMAGEERTAKVIAAWTASGDDGSAGTVTGYDLRWTTAIVQPTGLASSADFFDSSKAWPEASNLTVTTRTFVVPPLNSYFAYVRAYDEVGNYSGFVAANQLDNLATTLPNKVVTISNPRVGAAAADMFGVMMAANGSLNADGVDDLVLGYDGTTANRIFIHYGADAGFGTAPQEVVGTTIPVVGTAGFITTSFGRGVAVGPVSDSGRSDLLVGAPSQGNGVATLFFGTNAAQLDTSAANMVQFQSTIAGGFLGRVVSIIDDINNDGRSEILLTATGEDGFRGKVYLFYGRTVAQWRALANCPTTCAPIGVASADRIIRGPNPPNTVLGFGLFGRRGTGFINFGRSGAGTHNDFGIPASYEAYNRLFLFSGATVNADPAGTVYTTGFTPGTPDQSMQPPLSYTPTVNNREGGFGVSAVGNVNVVGASAPDLIVGYAAINQVYVFADRTASGFAGGFNARSLTLDGPLLSNFGWDTKVLDYTGDGKGDLLVGSYSAALAQPATGVWLFQNRGIAGSEFDQSVTAGFNVSRLSPAPAAGSSLGSALAKGDFNGDGKIDFVAADHLDGTGKVFVWQ